MPSIYFRFESLSRSIPVRHPALERLLEAADEVTPVVDWRTEAQSRVSGSEAILRAAPAAWFSAQVGLREPGADRGHVLIAAPVHVLASLTSVSLPRNGVLDLTPAESSELAADFNDKLAPPGVRLRASAAGRLFCLFDAALDVETTEPDRAAGRDLREFQPSGPDAPRLKKAGSEIEMWLFGHAVNLRRRERGDLAITGLWLWGGGPILDHLPPRRFEFLGTDVLFSAWAAQVPVAAPQPDRIVRCALAPGEPGFDDIGQDVFDCLRRSLRSRNPASLYLSGGPRCFRVRRMPRRFIFRRSKPWWEQFNERD